MIFAYHTNKNKLQPWPRSTSPSRLMWPRDHMGSFAARIQSCCVSLFLSFFVAFLLSFSFLSVSLSQVHDVHWRNSPLAPNVFYCILLSPLIRSNRIFQPFNRGFVLSFGVKEGCRSALCSIRWTWGSGMYPRWSSLFFTSTFIYWCVFQSSLVLFSLVHSFLSFLPHFIRMKLIKWNRLIFLLQVRWCRASRE